MTQMTFNEQVAVLRVEYGKIDKIDPGSPTYDALLEVLDSLDTVKLQQLADANIKWMSMLARNRVTRRQIGIK